MLERNTERPFYALATKHLGVRDGYCGWLVGRLVSWI